ncbi:stage III sporulation protein AC [Hydrogenibacillus schlegelii]|uniref:Stage III sporulation protein AC n=1 Tax=Hydrogenibacillus schlegelii TaxID=1484 RepID=A0A132NDR9_HYDSH|nr:MULTISPECIES: stage III sporulation protein AC [Hydrogenibacillus]KWX07722.1 stage III sporulation protein AC [Hydrogenibacillus schlegelii]MBE3563199.1 stage III sporulation protein AC [Hydrogenibacillus schlegelii]MBT9283281.1 stage III sporulation protein AC [Hydrogenibacillus schlegelii]OAR03243.1 stage III sporulation protein AC [Hydrogenibacillus schlegelii]PTQ53748.1 MAG: Stage III sporulation protein AC [Hydrogenibacillus schlegelii]
MGPEAQTLFLVAAVGIITGMLHTVLKQVGREDWADWLTLVGFVFVLSMIAGYLQNLFQHLQRVFHFY